MEIKTKMKLFEDKVISRRTFPFPIEKGTSFLVQKNRPSDLVRTSATIVHIVDVNDETVTISSLTGGTTNTSKKSLKNNYFSAMNEVTLTATQSEIIRPIKAFVAGGIKYHIEREIAPHLLAYGVIVTHHHPMDKSTKLLVPKGADLVIIISDMGGHAHIIDRAVEQAKKNGVPVIRTTRRSVMLDTALRRSRELMKLLKERGIPLPDIISTDQNETEENDVDATIETEQVSANQISTEQIPVEQTEQAVEQIHEQIASCEKCSHSLEESGECLNCLTLPRSKPKIVPQKIHAMLERNESEITFNDFKSALDRIKAVMKALGIKSLTVDEDGKITSRLE
jgi:hypothetical protein